MADSMQNSSMKGSVTLLKVTSRVRNMKPMAMRFTSVESAVTTSRMS